MKKMDTFWFYREKGKIYECEHEKTHDEPRTIAHGAYVNAYGGPEWYVHGERVNKKEWRKHILTEQLAGIE